MGFLIHRQRGSHIVLKRAAEPGSRVVVPDHAALDKGTLRAIIRQIGISVEEFNALL
jgi:predicted RNA binding protein YcfA (HicA-like mRNA interferase family)